MAKTVLVIEDEGAIAEMLTMLLADEGYTVRVARTGQDGPFVFCSRATGTYDAVYVQDNLKLGNLTANLGVRYDHNSLPMPTGSFPNGTLRSGKTGQHPASSLPPHPSRAST